MIYRNLWQPRHIPNTYLEVDWSHPLAQNLVGLFIPAMGYPLFNLIDNVQQTTTLGTIGDTASGPHLRDFAGATAESSVLNFTSAPWMVGAWGRLASYTANQGSTLFRRGVYVSESNNQGWTLGTNSGTSEFRSAVFNNNGSINYHLPANSITPQVGDVMMFSAVHASDTARWLAVYADFDRTNRREGYSTTKNRTAASAATGLTNTSGAATQFPLYVGYAWSSVVPTRVEARGLTDWLWAEPLCFLTQRSSIIYSIPLSVRHSGFWGVGGVHGTPTNAGIFN